MDLTSLPVVLVFGFASSKNVFTFLGYDGYIDIEYESSFVAAVLQLCNGRRSVLEIAQQMQTDTSEVLQLLQTLQSEGLVEDARALYRYFHRLSSNPMPFANQLSQAELEELVVQGAERGVVPAGLNSQRVELKGECTFDSLRRRHSTRSFAAAELAQPIVADFLAGLYRRGEEHYVPSAGELYGFGIYVVLPRPWSWLASGVYRYFHQDQTLVKVLEVAEHELTMALNADELVGDCPLTICLSVSMELVGRKYSNRGYRFALIEAGHIAQNAQMYCSENELGIFEYGGFVDTRLNTLLGLDGVKDIAVLSLGIGLPAQSEMSPQNRRQVVTEITESLVGKDKPIRFVGPVRVPNEQDISFYAMGANCSIDFGSPDNFFTFGTGDTRVEATLKALCEGVERIACGYYFVDVEAPASASALKDLVVTPAQLSPFSAQQLQDMPELGDFDPDAVWQWVAGRRVVSGAPCYVAVDNVFYPLNEEMLGRQPVYYASSSGVACHISTELAFQAGLVELIERDALMVHWLSQTVPPQLHPEQTDEYLAHRYRYWQGQGKRLHLLDLTLDSLPTFMVAIVGEGQPYFAAGAGSGFDAQAAMHKAVHEAELIAASWQTRELVDVSVEEISSTDDHGVFYAHQHNFQFVEWMLQGKTVEPQVRLVPEPAELRNRFDPVVVELRCEQASSLKVVRVLSEHLLPIYFGFGRENIITTRFEALGKSVMQQYPSQPHFFA